MLRCAPTCAILHQIVSSRPRLATKPLVTVGNRHDLVGETVHGRQSHSPEHDRRQVPIRPIEAVEAQSSLHAAVNRKVPSTMRDEDVIALQRAAGNQAVSMILMRDGPTASETLSDVTETGEVDVSLKEDAVLARGIVDGELGILRQWRDALQIFDKTMVSESDKSGTANYQKVVLTFFVDTVINSLLDITQVPGLPKGVPQPGKSLYGLLQKLEAEYKRAAAARESARLRDFFNTQLAQIASIDLQLTLAKDDFETTVSLAADQTGKNEQANSDYGVLRLWLVEHFQAVERRLAASDSSALFARLSEEWIKTSTVPIGMGYRSAARVIIRLEEDFGVRNGHIEGAGGLEARRATPQEFTGRRRSLPPGGTSHRNPLREEWMAQGHPAT